MVCEGITNTFIEIHSQYMWPNLSLFCIDNPRPQTQKITAWDTIISQAYCSRIILPLSIPHIRRNIRKIRHTRRLVRYRNNNRMIKLAKANIQCMNELRCQMHRVQHMIDIARCVINPEICTISKIWRSLRCRCRPLEFSPSIFCSASKASN